jgi:hypothetical protein
LRYEAHGAALYSGHCYCGDCRKASGSGFIAFMAFPAAALRFSGGVRQFRSPAASGRIALRNYCEVCGSLVFGGEVGVDESHTIYAGSLDDPSVFVPTIAIFTRGRPPWAVIPEGLTTFEALPG